MIGKCGRQWRPVEKGCGIMPPFRPCESALTAMPPADPTPKKVLCHVYKSLADNEMYLYVPQREDLARVPKALLEKFGRPQRVTTLVLTPGRKLARVDTRKVLDALLTQGFYLQLPPPPDETMRAIRLRNEKL